MTWQPMDTAPKDGTTVLVVVRDTVMTAWYSENTGLWPHSDEFNDDGEACNVGLPSCWMLLPELPGEQYE